MDNKHQNPARTALEAFAASEAQFGLQDSPLFVLLRTVVEQIELAEAVCAQSSVFACELSSAIVELRHATVDIAKILKMPS
jgi:hypothetical protein